MRGFASPQPGETDMIGPMRTLLLARQDRSPRRACYPTGRPEAITLALSSRVPENNDPCQPVHTRKKLLATSEP